MKVSVPDPIRISLTEAGEEMARASVYFLKNELHVGEHAGIVAYLEDVFVNDQYRSRGLGRKIVEQAIREARSAGAYKLIANSRADRVGVHEFYRKLGFDEHGKEFRVDLID